MNTSEISGNDSGDSLSAETCGSRSRRRGRWILARLAMVVVVAAAVVIGLLWWQEQSLQQIESALMRGDVNYAHYLVSNFLESRPQHQRARALRARVLVSMGRASEAISIFDEVGAANAADVHAWARAFMIHQEWSRAAPLLERTLEFDANNADALYELASCQVRLGELNKALLTAEQFAAISGQEARGYVFIGTIHGDLGNQNDAAEAFAAVLRLEPDAKNLQVASHEFLLQYGRTLQSLGKPEESLTPLKHSVAARENPDALVLLGDAALQLGKPENAEQAWRRAVELQPHNREARQSLANLALQRQRASEAIEWLKPLEHLPDLPASTAYLLQRAYALLDDQKQVEKWTAKTNELRKQEEIRSDIEHLMAEAPKSFWARAARAHKFAEHGNWRQAELMISDLLKEAPGDDFVIELADAIYRRAELPALERIPITRQ